MRFAIAIGSILLLSKLTSPAAAELQNDPYMSWHEFSTTNALTGKTTQEYISPGQTVSGAGGLTGSLRVRCVHGELQAYILFNRFFSTLSTFWYWVENGKVRGPFFGEAAAAGKASFLKSEDSVVELTKVFSQPEVRIQVKSAADDEAILLFGMGNADKFVGRAKAECKKI